jgi:hypothetical protein
LIVSRRELGLPLVINAGDAGLHSPFTPLP